MSTRAPTARAEAQRAAKEAEARAVDAEARAAAAQSSRDRPVENYALCSFPTSSGVTYIYDPFVFFEF